MALVPNIPNNRPLFQPSHIVTQHVGNMSGFNYSILPLQFNLQRGTRYKKSNRFTKCSCKVYPGEEVYGICPYDNKKHTGRIIRLYYDPTIDAGKEPKVIYAYIQDKIDNEIIPLNIDTVHKITYNNYNLREAFDFNKNLHKI